MRRLEGCLPTRVRLPESVHEHSIKRIRFPYRYVQRDLIWWALLVAFDGGSCMKRRNFITLASCAAVAAIGVVRDVVAGQPSSAGEAVMAWPITISPAWFDPSAAPPQITPFGILYALHDALVRPLPAQKMGNSLAESWTESPDGLTYEFKLRQGLKFHNGDA